MSIKSIKSSNEPTQSPLYGRTQTAEQLGRLARAHRKSRNLTLATVAGLGNLSIKFLSEFERGKPTAEIGKVLQALRILGLEVVVRPVGSHRSPDAE
jgi:hypothetical protein